MKLTEQRMECATCHEIFFGLSNFDRHRTGDERKCVHPGEVGLDFRDGVWRGPKMTDDQVRKAWRNR